MSNNLQPRKDARRVAAALAAPCLDSSVRAGAFGLLRVGAISLVAGLVILLQDALIASRFGASDSVDAYQLAMSFPLWALNVFAGGTLLAVLVPTLVQLEVAGRNAQVLALVREVRRAVTMVLLAIGALWAAAYPLVVGAIATEFSPATAHLSTRLLWLGLPAMVLSGLSSVESAVLNSHRRFGLLSALPAFMPAGVAVSVLLLGARFGIFAASIGLIVGSAAQLLAARYRSGRLLPITNERTEPRPILGDLVSGYAASAGAAALLGGIVMSDTFMASRLSPGSTAVFGFASRPIILLLAFATATAGNVTLPMFSRLAAASDFRKLKTRFVVMCGLLLAAGVPTVALIYTVAPWFVALLYQRGTFSAADAAAVVPVLQAYVLHVPSFMIAVIAWRVMNSLQRHTALLTITAIAFATNLAVDLWLMPRLGLVGIAWGTNVAFGAWAVLLIAYLWRVCQNHPRPEMSQV